MKKATTWELSQAQQQKLNKLEATVHSLIERKGKTRKNGKAASDRTIEAYSQTALGISRRLHHLGYQLEDIHSLGQRHIQALTQDWYERQISPKTLQQYISVLRLISHWIGKETLMPKSNAAKHYLPQATDQQLKVTTVAQQSKSWTDNGIDVIAKIKEAVKLDPRFGAMLRLGLFFGLRRKEQLRIIPQAAHRDGDNHIKIRGNIAKNGRERDIEIIHPLQLAAIDHAKKIAGRGKALGWEKQDHKQNYNKYSYLMKTLGITKEDADAIGHGLRPEFSENMALIFGFVPPTLGGETGIKASKETVEKRLRVSENLGHSRLSVTGAYYGTYKAVKKEGPQVTPYCWLKKRNYLLSQVSPNINYKFSIFTHPSYNNT